MGWCADGAGWVRSRMAMVELPARVMFEACLQAKSLEWECPRSGRLALKTIADSADSRIADCLAQSVF